MRFGPCVALAFLALFSAAAKADPYPVSGSGSGFSGAATLDATDDGGGTYTITSITGTSGYGLGVTGLIAPGGFNNGEGQKNDNLLFPSSSTEVVDTNGFAFTDTEGDTDFQVDVFSSGSDQYTAYLLDSDGVMEDIPVTLDVSMVDPDPVFTISFTPAPSPAVTPEPSSLALLGTGILGLAGVVRRRMRA